MSVSLPRIFRSRSVALPDDMKNGQTGKNEEEVSLECRKSASRKIVCSGPKLDKLVFHTTVTEWEHRSRAVPSKLVFE